MDLIRVWIEGFLRGRYGYEGIQVYWALAGLLLIGATGVAGLYLYGPLVAVTLIVLGIIAYSAFGC